ncbi:MAG: protein kinase [Planctomycetes bacterium]|nr:protein kinase [Planctomycetota bacterium]
MSERPKSSRLAALQGTKAGQTVQLGSDFLDYARQRYDPSEFKDALIKRLLPTVPVGGRPLQVRPRERFGKFDVRGRLGKGGMAEVYLAEDPEREPGAQTERQRYVALKVMKASIAHDPHYVKRFLREAANAALIEHPNVVTVFEVGAVEGRLYFTMELIEGETLKERLDEGPLSEEDGVVVLMQLLDGLLAAHERGIGHRDIKPSNVMLVDSRARYGVELRDVFDVQVKVTDFGLAQMMDIDQSESLEGRFLGTAKYVAPEVIRGKEATLKSDVFSLGILAFQLFSGTTPWRARSKVEYITANLDYDAPRLSDRAEVSAGLSDVVDRMLAKDPEQRPDASQLRRALGRLVAREHGYGGDLFSDDHARDRGPGVGATSDAPPTAVLVGFAVVVLLGLGLGALVLGGKPAKPPQTTPIANPDADPDPDPEADPDADPDSDGGVSDSPAESEAPLAVRQFGALKGLRAKALSEGERGDLAWGSGDAKAALSAWKAAAKEGGRVSGSLALRLQTGERVVALDVAKEARARGDMYSTYCALDRAVAAGADAEVVAERDALWAELEGRHEVLSALQVLRNAPAGARSEAREALSALRERAREVGLETLWRGVAERLGAGAVGADGGVRLGDGAVARRAPVSNAEFYRWYEQASKDEFLAPPSGWDGKPAPAAEQAEQPVLGVRVATARAYAETLGQRLPTDDELERMRLSGLAAEDPQDERYVGGFWTVRVEE